MKRVYLPLLLIISVMFIFSCDLFPPEPGTVSFSVSGLPDGSAYVAGGLTINHGSDPGDSSMILWILDENYDTIDSVAGYITGSTMQWTSDELEPGTYLVDVWIDADDDVSGNEDYRFPTTIAVIVDGDIQLNYDSSDFVLVP